MNSKKKPVKAAAVKAVKDAPGAVLVPEPAIKKPIKAAKATSAAAAPEVSKKPVKAAAVKAVKAVKATAVKTAEKLTKAVKAVERRGLVSNDPKGPVKVKKPSVRMFIVDLLMERCYTDDEIHQKVLKEFGDLGYTTKRAYIQLVRGDINTGHIKVLYTSGKLTAFVNRITVNKVTGEREEIPYKPSNLRKAELQFDLHELQFDLQQTFLKKMKKYGTKI